MAETVISENKSVPFSVIGEGGTRINPTDACSVLRSLTHVDAESFNGDNVARRKALKEAQALVRRLETTSESLFSMGCFYPLMYTSLKVCQDFDVFNKLAADEGKPKSTGELSGSVEPGKIRRYLKHLASMHIVREVGEDIWASTRVTDDLRKVELAAYIDMSDMFWYKFAMLVPEWLKRNDYRDPSGLTDCPFMDIASLPFFEYIKATPERQATFTAFMRGNRSAAPSWTEVFPTERLFATLEPEGCVLVDQGGSGGHDAQRFLDKHPEAAGRIVFQDQPHVIEPVRSTVDSRLTPMVHDFFTEQPIKGARIYFMHVVLHNWPDKQCHDILNKLKPAFKPGYSTLLIMDQVLPATEASSWQTSDEIIMKNVFGAVERSISDWYQLLESTGYKILKIHTIASSDEAIIEAVPIE